MVLCGLAGFAAAHAEVVAQQLLAFGIGILLLSGGSLALNQVQEHKLDELMPRTQKRPLPQKELSFNLALLLSTLSLGGGLLLLYQVAPLSAALGLLTVALYNGIYTPVLKPRSPLAAVFGALPGALPVTMGVAAAGGDIFAPASFYIFAIVFFWQLPHFWILALRYKDDYILAGIPVLPGVKGNRFTLTIIVGSTFVYLMIALFYPQIFGPGWAYAWLVLPVCLWVAAEAVFYLQKKGQEKWFRFFLALNTSVLVFLLAAVVGPV